MSVSRECPCKRVLVIDDGYLDRVVAEKQLRKYGYAGDVVSIESGKNALSYLENGDHTPSLILLDLNMPEMNGFEFLHEYEKLPEPIRANSAIVMLTSSINPADKTRAMNNPHVQQYVIKPITLETINIVHEITDRYFIDAN